VFDDQRLDGMKFGVYFDSSLFFVRQNFVRLFDVKKKQNSDANRRQKV